MEKNIIEGQKKFFSTLWNTYAFFVLYANIDGFKATGYSLEECKLTVMDKWLLFRLNTAVGALDSHLSVYRVPESARLLQDFVDEMSNGERVEEVLRRNQESILGDVLGKECVFGALEGYTVTWDVNGEETSFGVVKCQ